MLNLFKSQNAGLKRVRYLALLPLLQLLLIYFAFAGESQQLFGFLALSILIGVLAFHFIRKFKTDDRLEWFSFLYSSSAVAAVFTLPVGLWFFLYTNGESISVIALPFHLFLPLCMSFFEVCYIFRGAKS